MSFATSYYGYDEDHSFDVDIDWKYDGSVVITIMDDEEGFIMGDRTQQSLREWVSEESDVDLEQIKIEFF